MTPPAHAGTIAMPRRFYSLDALRGLAALCVVLFHWHHFFFDGFRISPYFTRDHLPLIDILYPLYTQGYHGVALFFSLSGFIFYWLYSREIAERSITASHLFVLRFSRLYPLHLLTLLAAAAGQMAYSRAAGTYFVYPNNDSYHFLLNLLLVNQWGFEEGHSFNGPAWSISVEVVLYLLFFVLCRALPMRAAVLLLACVAGMALGQVNILLAQGIVCFFLGGCTFIAYRHIIQRGWVEAASLTASVLAVVAWTFTALALHRGWTLVGLPVVWRLSPFYGAIVLFPVTILALALIETRRGVLGRRIAFLGDISYSVYLLHFPLQLAFATVAVTVGIGSSFSSPLTLLVFMGALILISACSHAFFERPLQRYLRDHLAPAPSAGRDGHERERSSA